MTSYDEIYERFSQKITDFKILELSDTDVRNMMHGWLMTAIAKFRRCMTDLSDRDDDLEEFNNDLLDIEIEILAQLMVCAWIEPQMNSDLYISQFYGGKEEKWFAQSNQLNSIITLHRQSYLTAQKLMRDYGYQTAIWDAREEST